MRYLYYSFYILLFSSCVDKEKIKQEAYDQGFEKGQKVKYTDLVKKYYSDTSILKLNQNTYTSDINSTEEIKKLQNNTKKDFQSVVYDLNRDLLNGISVRLNLADGQKKKILEVYEESHQNISNEYYRQYIDLCRKKELGRKPEEFIKYTSYDRTQVLAEVMSSQLCSTIGFIVGSLNLDYHESNIAGILAGTPCVTISTELLKPLTNSLLESGFVLDITNSKTTVERKASEMIVEMASIKKEYSTTIDITNEVKTFWGLFNSTAEASANYYGIVKAGYSLGNKFQINVDNSNSKIYIIVDKPTIFEPAIFPNITKIQNGIFAKIDENTLNQMQIKATNKILDVAINDNILSQAENNAKMFLYSIFEPIAKIPPKQFDIEIISLNDVEKKTEIGNTKK